MTVTGPLVALLRGVNIGKRRVAMADLRAGLASAGCTDVQTYVQSGNVVLNPPAGWANVCDELAAAVTTIAGFAIDVVVRTRDDLHDVIRRNPYPEAGGTQLHVVFFAGRPRPDPLSDLDMSSFHPEHATLSDRELYLHLPDGMGRSALATALERGSRRSSTVATTRNWNTVQRLVAMLD